MWFVTFTQFFQKANWIIIHACILIVCLCKLDECKIFARTLIFFLLKISLARWDLYVSYWTPTKERVLFVTSQRVDFKHTLSSKLDTHVTVTISKVGPFSNGPDQVTDLCFIKPTAMIHATKKQPSCNHRRFMSSWLDTRSTTREEESLTFWSSLSDKCLLLNFLFPEGLSLPSGDASFSE